MHQITIQTLENGATFEVPFRGGPVVQQRDRLKVWRERIDLRYLLRRTDKKIFIRVIQPAQRPHHIPRVSAYAELGHPPDINGDLHGTDLTTKDTKVHKGIRISGRNMFRVRSGHDLTPSLLPAPWLDAPDIAGKYPPVPA